MDLDLIDGVRIVGATTFGSAAAYLFCTDEPEVAAAEDREPVRAAHGHRAQGRSHHLLRWRVVPRVRAAQVRLRVAEIRAHASRRRAAAVQHAPCLAGSWVGETPAAGVEDPVCSPTTYVGSVSCARDMALPGHLGGR